MHSDTVRLFEVEDSIVISSGDTVYKTVYSCVIHLFFMIFVGNS